MDTKLINASIDVERHVSRAIPFRRRLRAVLVHIAVLTTQLPGIKLEDIAVLLTLLAIMLITYFVDFGMLSPIGEFAGRSSRIGAAVMMQIIPVGLPALVLLVESWLANKRHEAIENQKDRMFPDPAEVRRYSIAIILFSLFIPAMNIGLTRALIAHLHAAGANDARLEGLQLSLIVLALLSCAGHLVVGFSGDKPKKLKTLALYGMAVTALTILKKIREWRYEPLRRIARLRVIQYLYIREQYMRETGTTIPIGPFANDVQEWIKEEFTDLDIIDPDDDDAAAPTPPKKK